MEKNSGGSKAAIVMSHIVEKTEMIFGIILVAFFLFCLLGCLVTPSLSTGDTVAMIFCLVFLAIGVLLIYKSCRRKKMRKLFKIYVAQLSVDPSGTIENMAGATNTSVDAVKKNLRFMIKKRFFSNAYIDEMKNQLVIPSMAQKSAGNNSKANNETQANTNVCKCPNCGGVNTIAEGSVSECDFCGSPLQG